MIAAPRVGVPALLPLAVLEALRALDTPPQDQSDEPHGELTAKRLGLNRTVWAEITRLERLARRRSGVPGQEYTALQRLVTRRPDATQVFSDAGRRAAQRAVAELPAATRGLWWMLPGGPRRAFGFRVARRLAARVFGATLRRPPEPPAAELAGSMAVLVEPGVACAFIGAALAELLRRLAGFDGAMMHATCRSRGNAMCTWSAGAAAPPPERST